jgi:hypothetical protein
VTTYTYDEHDRIVEAVTITEPEWDETERAWGMTLTDVEADVCNGCGQPLSESLTLEAYEGYESGPPATCQGCKALHRRQREYEEDKDVRALRFSVNRTWKEETDLGH